MIRLRCERPNCDYNVIYPDSMEPMLADAQNNSMGTYQCPLCHSFGLRVQKSKPKKQEAS